MKKLSILIPIALPLIAIALWLLSIRNLDIRAITDLGLVSILPPLFYVAFTILTISFCFVLHWRRFQPPILLLHFVALIFMLSGTPTLIQETPRLHVAWRHAGFVEYIMRIGGLEHKIDAYFDWPGFFALSAFLTQVTGFESPLSLISWASVFFNLLYLGPLVMILRVATSDKRVVWLGTWCFYLTHWSGYDFFAPQALNYYLYMMILGILLTWFRVMSVPRNTDTGWPQFRLLAKVNLMVSSWFDREDNQTGMPSKPVQRLGLLIILLALFFVSVSSHMLTPFFILASVTMLVVSNRLVSRGLPVLMAVMIGSWLTFMSISYLSGHMDMVTGSIGDITSNVDANIVRRLRGSPEHLFVVKMRLIVALAIWGLGFLGWIRRLWNRNLDLTFLLLALVPFPVLALQPYGGEIMLRIYMFSLPPLLFFVAALFYGSSNQNSPWYIEMAVGLLSLLFLFGFLFARYGNERIDNFTSQEISAVQFLYHNAEHGSKLVAVNGNLPWQYRDYENYRYFRLLELGGSVIREMDIDVITAGMQRNHVGRKTYLIFTRSQESWSEVLLGWEPGTFDQLEQAFKASDKYRLIFENDDATIFVLLTDS